MAIAQLLETTMLNLINYPSLIATNAARMRLAAGQDKSLLEFGLRRAQGPDGGISASKYAHLGGFDGTSNVLAGKLFGIDVKGTHAHSFVMCYVTFDDLKSTTIASREDPTVQVEFVARVLEKRALLRYQDTNEGELVAFIAYAQAFPSGFLALVDTYDTISSGLRNFVAVGWALHELGYRPLGIRLDSGDLAYLSKVTRRMFRHVDKDFMGGQEVFGACTIVASNDINEEVITSLNREGHEIDVFGIGTHLVTCANQPALGCVYKLVEINSQPRIKLSQEVEKLVIPGRKELFRLYGSDGHPLLDLMLSAGEEEPVVGQRILVRHPFAENKRANITPTAVKPLLRLVYDGPSGGIVQSELRSLRVARDHCRAEISAMRNDHVRTLNPTPYKVSVSSHLYEFMHTLWLNEAPIADLS